MCLKPQKPASRAAYEIIFNKYLESQLGCAISILNLSFFALLLMAPKLLAFDLSLRLYSNADASSALEKIFSNNSPENNSDNAGSDPFGFDALNFDHFSESYSPPTAVIITRDAHFGGDRLGLFSELTYFRYSAWAAAGATAKVNDIPITFKDPLAIRGQAFIAKGGLYKTYNLSSNSNLTGQVYVVHQNLSIKSRFGNWDMVDRASDTFPGASIGVEFSSIFTGAPTIKFGAVYAVDNHRNHSAFYIEF